MSKGIRLNTNIFIEKSRKTHGAKYDYSLVDYKCTNEKVKIICPEHGIFKQRPDNHIIGKGCILCKGHKKLTTNEFLKKVKEIHGNSYDYSLVEYKNARTKIKIICPKHGIFEILPIAFISYAYNCIKCTRETTLKKLSHTNKQFIEKAKEVHEERYDYSLVEYKNTDTKVKITCSIHGEFDQTPHSHLQKSGCPKCKKINKFSKGEKEVLDYIKTFYNKEIINNKFDIIFPYELDIFLPELKIGIEYNGTYWHRLKEQKNPGCHKLKAKLCKNNNIKLINISDINWIKNKNKIKKRLLRTINEKQ